MRSMPDPLESLMQSEQDTDSDLKDYRAKIAQFWTALELLKPCLSPPLQNRMEEHIIDYKITDERPHIPWEKDHPHQKIDRPHPDAKWKYTILAGESHMSYGYKQLQNQFVSQRKSFFEKAEDRYFNIFSVDVNEDGYVDKDTFKVSSFAWAIGLLKDGADAFYNDVSRFQDAEADLNSRFLKFYHKKLFQNGDPDGEEDDFDSLSHQDQDPLPLTFDLLKDLLQTVCGHLNLNKEYVLDHFIISARLVFPEDDRSSEFSGILNSFFLTDLFKLYKYSKADRLNTATQAFLTKSIDVTQRFDIRRDVSHHLKWLAPNDYPKGCWPSADRSPLVFSQQAAVNACLKGLRNEGIFSVNGPPGTGKTTMLRDVIAGVVVQRALQMMTFKNPKLAFERGILSGSKDEKSKVYTPSHLIAGYEIVVASSNNAAVENITLEIPGMEAVHPSALTHVDYFASYAKKLLPHPQTAWGLLAAKLGNMANRNRFVVDFWLDALDVSEEKKALSRVIVDRMESTKGFEGCLNHFMNQAMLSFKDQTEVDNDGVSLTKAQETQWDNTVKQLQDALDKEQALRQKHQSVFDRLRKKENLDQESAIPLFLRKEAVSFIDRELSAPWDDDDWVRAREQVFLMALQLHKTFISLNARVIRNNLKNLMISLVTDFDATSEEMTWLWQTLFLVIPVISTTFASFIRLFANIDMNSIGWLLIDEAGQATPQSAVGALMHSKRVLMIGDPLQLEPINFIDHDTQFAISTYGQIESKWLPSRHSALELADRVNRFGTYLDDVWVGMPLRVHRRCEKTMFEISNRIAYDNMMIYGTLADEDALTTTPKNNFGLSGIFKTPSKILKSQWFDVASESAVTSHFIPEEATKLKGLLDELKLNDVRMDDVFIITPFRAVRYQTHSLCKEYGVEIATIHSVQGKENDVVILMLGGNPQKPGAARWATQSPNLLNVAVTRAKKRLYVIGNKKLWGHLRYANVLYNVLNNHAKE